VFVQVSPSVGARVQAVCHGISVRGSNTELKHVFDACLDPLEHPCYNSYRRSIEHRFDGRAAAGMEEMMSAIAWEPAEATHLAPVGRPRLVVLDGGGGVPESSAGVRLTRRGRVVLLLLVALAVVASVALTGIRGAGAAEPGHTVTVRAGQTLSEVAAAELPDLSISQGVLAIQLANRLSTAQVSAGQELVIPRS
jgi:hypothetical protein